MADILHELSIQSSPDAVYKALTEQDGLRAWWTAHSSAAPTVGSVSEFKFNNGQVVFKMKINALKPGQAVHWEVLQGAPDWSNTRVTFDIKPADQGTTLLMGHRDFATTEGSFASTNYNWAWFLMSLKAYLETGKGTPYQDN